MILPQFSRRMELSHTPYTYTIPHTIYIHHIHTPYTIANQPKNLNSVFVNLHSAFPLYRAANYEVLNRYSLYHQSSRLQHLMSLQLWVEKNLCGRLIDMRNRGPQHVKCDNPELMAGRYISIGAGTSHLAICEVQVSIRDSNLNNQQHE
jgi:hypothetical protein